MEKRYLGIKQLADYLGVKEGTLYQWVFYRRIPFVRIGRLVKFDLRRIEEWLKESSVEVCR